MGAKPKILKLYQIKAKLEDTIQAKGSPLPYGGGNPYYYCPECKRSMIEVSYAGHHKGCEIHSLNMNLKSLEGQIKKELEAFIHSGEVNGVSFKNFRWQKQDIFVPELDKLLRDIEEFCSLKNE